MKAPVEEMLKNSSSLAGTGPQNPGADTVWSRGLALVNSLQMYPHLGSCHRQGKVLITSVEEQHFEGGAGEGGGGYAQGAHQRGKSGEG